MHLVGLGIIQKNFTGNVNDFTQFFIQFFLELNLEVPANAWTHVR